MNWLEQPISLEPLRVAALFLWDVGLWVLHACGVFLAVTCILIAGTMYVRVLVFESLRIVLSKRFRATDQDNDAASWATCAAALALTIAALILF